MNIPAGSSTGGGRPALPLLAAVLLLSWVAGCSATPPHPSPHGAAAAPPPKAAQPPARPTGPPASPPATPTDPDRAPQPLELPTAAETTLPSGLRVVLIEQPAATIATLELRIAAGSLDDRPGVASLAAELLRHGAGASIVAARFAAALAPLGGQLGATAAPHTSRLGLSVSRERVPAAASLVLHAVAGRQLRGASFDRLRARAIARARARAVLRPARSSDEMLLRALLGGGRITSRRARGASSSELGRVRLAHVDAYFRRLLVPQRATLVVVGGFAPSAVLDAARGAWPKRKPATTTPPALEAVAIEPFAPTSYRLDRSGGGHTTVALGLLLDTTAPPAMAALALWGAMIREVVATRLDEALGAHARGGVAVKLLATTERWAAVAVRVRVPSSGAASAAAALGGAVAQLDQQAPELLPSARRRCLLQLAAIAGDPRALASVAGRLLDGHAPLARYAAYPRALLSTAAPAEPLRNAVRGRVLVYVGDGSAADPPPAGFPPPIPVDADRGFTTASAP